MADTGASISVAGLDYARQLREDNLLPTAMSVSSADGSFITVVGTVLVSIEGAGVATKEQVYICKGTRRCLLSLEACIALGIVPDTFPAPGSSFEGSNIGSGPSLSRASEEKAKEE